MLSDFTDDYYAMSSPFEVRRLPSHGRVNVIGIVRTMCHMIADVMANHCLSSQTVRVLPVCGSQFAKYPHPSAAGHG